MSELVFPSLPGLAWGLQKRIKWASRVQKSVSGKRQAIGYMSYPDYEYTLNFNVLRQYAGLTDVEDLHGFFNQLMGRVDTFLFADPLHAAVTDQGIGTGDGTNKDFQLVAAYGGFAEPVQAPAIITNVKVDGSTAAYTDQGNGIVRITTAPAIGDAVTWTGTFRKRCAFTQDTLDFLNQDGVDIWKSNKITFETVKV